MKPEQNQYITRKEFEKFKEDTEASIAALRMEYRLGAWNRNTR